MSFGQPSGPPASAKQVSYLLSLIEQAGHTGFRDARGALGLTQRQGGGKFTKDEASALIERLLTDGEEPGAAAEPEAPPPRRAATRPPTSPLGKLPAKALAAELERRGWTVVAPPPAD